MESRLRTTLMVAGLVAMFPLAPGAQTMAPYHEARRSILDVAPSPRVQGPATRRDSLKNGTLIGAAIGFAAGFLALAAYNAHETASGPIWDGEAVGVYTSAGLIGAGIGAGLGALIDASKAAGHSPLPTHSRVNVRPIIGREVRGASVSLRF